MVINQVIFKDVAWVLSTGDYFTLGGRLLIFVMLFSLFAL